MIYDAIGVLGFEPNRRIYNKNFSLTCICIAVTALVGRSGETRTPSLSLPKRAVYQIGVHPDNYLRKLHLERTFSWVALHNTRRLKLVCVANRTSHCEILSFIHSSGSPNECPSRSSVCAPVNRLIHCFYANLYSSPMNRSTANTKHLDRRFAHLSYELFITPIRED